jgi:transposase
MPAVPVSKSRRDPDATGRQWVERVERFRQSGQTVARFCAAEGVSETSLYVWKRTLAADTHATAPSPTVVPIRLTPSPVPTAVIELSLPGGAVVRFPPDIRPDVLIFVLRRVETGRADHPTDHRLGFDGMANRVC